MGNVTSINIARFIILVLIQVLICNHINFLGYINPYIYILFIALYPIKNSRLLFIFISFLLGLSIDLFQDSGGIHAASSVLIAYIRPIALKTAFGTLYEHQTIKFNTVDISSKIVYIAILTVIHHFVLFSLEFFSISKILFILQKTLSSSVFTILLCTLITVIFSKKNK
ncbi:MAG: rod shape-determining protein MreD [Aestuariibaculum sp.]